MQKYKPRWYSVNVAFQLDAPAPAGVVPVGALGQGSITIQNLPFVLRRITAANLGLSNVDWAGAGVAVPTYDQLMPLGWAMNFRTDSHVYMTDLTVINAALGTVNDWLDSPSAVEIFPKSTVTFQIENLLERTALTTLQMIIHGVEPAETLPGR